MQMLNSLTLFAVTMIYLHTFKSASCVIHADDHIKYTQFDLGVDSKVILRDVLCHFYDTVEAELLRSQVQNHIMIHWRNRLT